MRTNPEPSRFAITVAVMAATVIQVLDTTIVNVALPEMQGNLGATSDQISWVLTSYLVASAIFMPLTGYFTDRLGRRRYLLVCIAGFVFASALCGLAFNLASIVTFRVLQGVFGAALVPLSQAIMADTYPPQERGKAMAIWGIGVMVGPILGPTLGGYLTQAFNWRWTFLINLPVGLASFLLAWRVVPDTVRRERAMDWTGFALLSCAVGAAQFVLDRGNQEDWFQSPLIVALSIAAVAAFVAFLWYGLTIARKPVFDLRIFTDRNFTTATILVTALGVGMFGGMVIQPLMLESLLGYPTLTTGLVMAPRGFASMASMMLVGRLLGKVDTRLLVGTGVLFSAAGSYAMTHYSLDINVWWAIWPTLLQGFGIGMIYVPLSTLALSSLSKELAAEAAGLYSLTRTIGASVGISVVSTFFARHIQSNWMLLGGGIQPFNPALSDYLQSLQLPAGDPRALALVAAELGKQAQITSMVETYWLITASFLAMLPLLALLKPRRPAPGEAQAPIAME